MIHMKINAIFQQFDHLTISVKSASETTVLLIAMNNIFRWEKKDKENSSTRL